MGSHDGIEECCILTGQPLQFALGELGGINRDTALTPAVGDIHDGALERHGGGQGLNLIHVHLLVVADAALVRAPDSRMLYSVALKDLDGSVRSEERRVGNE